MTTENEIVPYENSFYKKSNFLISAKYKSTLLENKLLAISLFRVREDDNGDLLSEITTPEIRKILGKSNGSLFDQLKLCAKGFASRQISMYNKENNEFAIVNIIATASYQNGVFCIRYNKDIKNFLYNLQSNYTNLNVGVLMKFRSVYSFRLYELLKSKAYYPKNAQETGNIFKITYSLAELKLELGAVNSNTTKVQKLLVGKNPDFEKAVEVAEEKTFSRWSDFKAKVLEVAIKEINGMPETEMYITYDVGRKGVGGKIHEVYFTVELLNCKKRETSQNDSIVDVESINPNLEKITMELILNCNNLMKDQNLSFSDLNAIILAGAADYEKIKEKYALYKKQKDVNNFVGWMVAALRNGYGDVRKNPFNEFMESGEEVDWDAFERDFVSNT